MTQQHLDDVRGDTDSPLSFSAIVCAYTMERWDDLQRALTSLLTQSRPADEVILVSDHNDELLAQARAAFPSVRCIPSAGPRGLSGARNTGVAAATSDIVGFLDDDAAAAPDWVATMLAAYGESGVVGVAGHAEPEWRAARPKWFPDEFLWVVGCSYTGLPTTRADVRNPIGANMSFRRKVVLAVGGFDTNIGRLGKDAAGCEETELAIRVRRQVPGSRVLLEPAARCIHAVTPARTTRQYFRQRCMGEGRSKALVSSLAGPADALSSERTYVLRTLPRGVTHGVVEATRGQRAGLARAVAIVEGVTLTVFSYSVARWHQLRGAFGAAPNAVADCG